MIYLSSDTHGDIDINKLSASHWPEGKNLTEDDVVIICGDFGLVWDPPNNISGTERAWTKWLNSKPWTTLFVDGNHENFSRLYSYPIIKKYGGQVHKVSDKIFHLMRGEYYNIQSKTFWVMGGATSVDKWARQPYISWWEEEMPTYKECVYGYENLESHGLKVDYILTHCAPSVIVDKIYTDHSRDALTDFLDIVYHSVDFKHWYCGHYHRDQNITDKFTILYNNIVRID